ncbi:hypothetical protein OHQ88_10580 [Micromonospora zamorensis]|uniref:hypothetical protein n=1 Tax=Micromonospora zamorensis TaxID=709883 RepID=UPI002E23A6B4
MSAFINAHTGVVVSVADHKDGRFTTPLWQPYDGTDPHMDADATDDQPAARQGRRARASQGDSKANRPK